MVLGYVLAVLATLASGSGSILESMGVRRAGAYGGTSLDLVALRHQWLYFLGLGVDLVGFACAAAALHLLPLFLVQSMLAFSIGVTAAISSFMGTRIGVPGWSALGVGAVGLVLLGVSADPGPARELPPQWRWLVAAMAIPIVAIALFTQRRNHVWAAAALACGAGIAFSLVGISARTLHLPDEAWQLVLEPSVIAMALNGLTAAVLFAMSLQKGNPTTVTAVMFTTNTALSSLIGLVYLDDQVRTGYATAAAAGFVLAIGGAIGVAHYSAGTRPTRREAVDVVEKSGTGRG
ncbi:hypothetical protein ACWGE0_06485 [Lentzea sp. NPDC054927]